MRKQIYLAIILLGLFCKVNGQELSGFKDKKPLAFTGAFGMNHVFSASSDPLNGRLPYSYVLTGSLATSIFDISFPFSFTYSNQQFNYSQPFHFNQFGVQPTYKWIKTYLGYNSMSFGKYTMSGHQFLGVGVELAPTKSIFRLSAVYGRFIKAVEEDTLTSGNTPAYRRIGYGLKAGVQQSGNEVFVTFFKGKDDIESLDEPIIKSEIKPQENLVVGLNGQANITKDIRVHADMAYSIIARNQFLLEQDKSGLIGFFDFWITNREAMEGYLAGNIGANYNIPGGTIGVQYERVDPGYSTMGAYYFTNDLENIALNLNKQLFKGKLNVSGNIGYERNNLNDKSESSSNRLVTSANVVVLPTDGVNVGLTFSNFKSYTHINSVFDKINATTPYANYDTLKFTQISTQAGVNASFRLGDPNNKKMSQNVSVNFDFQKASSLQHSASDISNFYNAGSFYNLSDKRINLNTTLGVNVNYSDFATGNSFTVGPSLSLSKPFFDKKLKSRLSIAYNKSFANGVAITQTTMFRAGASYIYKKEHSFNLNALFALRSKPNQTNQKSNEFTLTFGYNYNFSIKNIFNKKASKSNLL